MTGYAATRHPLPWQTGTGVSRSHMRWGTTSADDPAAAVTVSDWFWTAASVPETGSNALQNAEAAPRNPSARDPSGHNSEMAHAAGSHVQQ